MAVGGKKPKLEENNHIYALISNMAVAGNKKQDKNRPNAKIKEKSENIMKDLLSELDNEYEGNNSDKFKNNNSKINIDLNKHNFSFKNNKTPNVSMNSNFINNNKLVT